VFDSVSGFKAAFEACLDSLFVSKVQLLTFRPDARAEQRDPPARHQKHQDTPSRTDYRSYLSQRIGMAAVQKSSQDKPNSPKQQLRSIYSPHSRLPDADRSFRDGLKSKRMRPYSNSELNRTAGSFQKKHKTSLLSISRNSKRGQSPQALQVEQESALAVSNKRSFKQLSAKDPLSRELFFKPHKQNLTQPAEPQPLPKPTTNLNVLGPSPKANLSPSHAKNASTEADPNKRATVNSCRSLDAKEYLFTKQDLQRENDPHATCWTVSNRKSFHQTEPASAKKPQVSPKHSVSPSIHHSRLLGREDPSCKKKPAPLPGYLCHSIEIKLQNNKDFTPLFF